MHAHLANLEKIGLLRRDPSKPRAIELLDRAVAERWTRGIVRAEALPLLGSVAAGQPMLAEENIEEYVSVPEIAGGGDGEYLLRIRGDSMKDAGILEGDFVVVRSQDTAQDGDVVVALLGEEATVKRFFRETDHIRLQPENDDDGADSQQGGQGARARGGPAQERLSGAAAVADAAGERPCCAFAARSTRYCRWCRSGSRGGAGLRGKSGHHRAGWSRDRPGETRGKVPQKQTAYVRRPT